MARLVPTAQAWPENGVVQKRGSRQASVPITTFTPQWFQHAAVAQAIPAWRSCPALMRGARHSDGDYVECYNVVASLCQAIVFASHLTWHVGVSQGMAAVPCIGRRLVGWKLTGSMCSRGEQQHGRALRDSRVE